MENNDQTMQELSKLMPLLKGEGHYLKTSEFVTAIQAVADVVKALRKDNAGASEAAVKAMDKIQTDLDRVLATHAEIGGKADASTAAAENLAKKFNKIIADLGVEWEKLRQEMSLIHDGKDAPEMADIVAEVLAQIKLPEHKDFILKGEDIVDNINALPTDNDEDKIDASHIKNLPQPKPSGGKGGGAGGIRGLTSTNELLDIDDDPVHAGFKRISLALTVSDTAPSNPQEHDLWVDIS